MIPQEIIRKKRNGEVLSSIDLDSFFTGYLKGSVSDYQVSAMLMAIYLKGMTPVETAALTKISRDSGKVFDWKSSDGLTIDKHSTGGIGDKTSIVLLPLCLLEGLRVPMIAGRGLGHTGGTLDKLEAIPGMSVFLPEDKISEQVKTLGGIFMGQTEEIAALDKKLYSIRDVTSTVESIPLIVASILSKKLAEGLDGLVMDIKFGSGAFMSEISMARELGQSLVDVGKECGLNVQALLTDMNSPLGDFAGNVLEIYECLEILKDRGPKDCTDLIITLATEMVKLAKPQDSEQEIKSRLKSHLTSGKALELFYKVIESQGGDVKFLDDKQNFFKAKIKKPVILNHTGDYVNKINTRDLGMAIIALGGGRRKVSDSIDPQVGLSGLKKIGDKIEKDEPVAYVYGNDKEQVEEAIKTIMQAYTLGDKIPFNPLVLEKLK